jgi:hypothetical protein
VYQRADVVSDHQQEDFFRLRIGTLAGALSVKTRFIIENVLSELLRLL